MQQWVRAHRDPKAILTRVEPLVRDLFNRLGDAAKVVPAVKTDPSLDDRARQVALQVFLRISVEGQPADIRESGVTPLP